MADFSFLNQPTDPFSGLMAQSNPDAVASILSSMGMSNSTPSYMVSPINGSVVQADTSSTPAGMGGFGSSSAYPPYSESQLYQMYPLEAPNAPLGSNMSYWDNRRKYNEYENYVGALPSWQQPFYRANETYLDPNYRNVAFAQRPDGSIVAVRSNYGGTAQEQLNYVQEDGTTDFYTWDYDPSTGKSINPYYYDAPDTTGMEYAPYFLAAGTLLTGGMLAPLAAGSIAGGAALGAGLSGASSALNQQLATGSVDLGKTALATGMGAAGGAVGGYLGGSSPSIPDSGSVASYLPVEEATGQIGSVWSGPGMFDLPYSSPGTGSYSFLNPTDSSAYNPNLYNQASLSPSVYTDNGFSGSAIVQPTIDPWSATNYSGSYAPSLNDVQGIMPSTNGADINWQSLAQKTATQAAKSILGGNSQSPTYGNGSSAYGGTSGYGAGLLGASGGLLANAFGRGNATTNNIVSPTINVAPTQPSFRPDFQAYTVGSPTTTSKADMKFNFMSKDLQDMSNFLT